MPRLNILSISEQRSFDSPKELSGEERKLYFRSSNTISVMLASIKHSSSKVFFILMLHHFKISKKVFSVHRFSGNDIEYVSRQLGLKHIAYKKCNLGKQAFQRYKKKILEHMGYQFFDQNAKELLRSKAYKLAMQYTRPHVIFNDCIELLLEQKIEVPKYNTVRLLISDVLQQHKDSLLKVLSDNLPIEIKKWLDELLMLNDGSSVYKLTSLKIFYQSVRPKEIRFNTADFKQLQEMHDELQPMIDKLPISIRGIEYFATTVIKSDVFRIKRREERDRYLHLVAFIIYQYARLHDALIEIWLKAVSSFNNSSKREHKNRCYEFHHKHKQALKDCMGNASIQNKGIKAMYSIHKQEAVSMADKYKQISNILEGLLGTITEIDVNLIENRLYNDSGYFKVLEEKSRSLQSKLSPILKVLRFDKAKSSAYEALKAIEYFQERGGNLTAKPPMKFLNAEEKEAVISNGKIRVSLYKALLFRKIAGSIKSGSLNLISSYKFKALDEYIIPKDEWEGNKSLILKQAGLEKFSNCSEVLSELKNTLDKDYIRTNGNIINGKNQQIKAKGSNDFILNTPALETEESKLSDYLPESRTVPMQEILSTVNKLSGFLKSFEYYKTTYGRQSTNELIIAGIMSLGYGMGNNDIATISNNISSSALENTVNWCFTVENIRSAINEILRLTETTTIPNLYVQGHDKVHTSSDGQKWKVMYDSLNANYSFKYYGREQGATVVSFIDKKHLLFYSTVMSSAIREAAYVIDGLMHNSVVKSDIHSTDTHGYSEVVFTVTHFLSIFFAPRIKGIKHQILSMFPGYKSIYKAKSYKLLPTHTINVKIIEESYDEILRFIATIKLKRSTASQLLSRLNSYSMQHKLYQALKEFGKIIKSTFILKYIDDLKLRQSIEKQLNLVENNNKFSNAIAQENDHSFVQQTQEEQIMAESCRRLMKAAIIFWNCLYLRKKIDDEPKQNKRVEIINNIKNGSIMIWRHVNLKGEYDFSDEKTKDKYGLKLDYSNSL